MLAVKLSEELSKAAEDVLAGRRWTDFGWEHHSSRYQSPQFTPELRNQRETARRSTLVKKEDQWELVEMAEPLMKLLDQEEEIEELRGREQGKVMTFVADEGNAPENFGFELEESYAVLQRRPEVFDDLAIPKASTDEDFEEFPVNPEESGGADLDDQRVHHEIGIAVSEQTATSSKAPPSSATPAWASSLSASPSAPDPLALTLQKSKEMVGTPCSCALPVR